MTEFEQKKETMEKWAVNARTIVLMDCVISHQEIEKIYEEGAEFGLMPYVVAAVMTGMRVTLNYDCGVVCLNEDCKTGIY